MSPIKVLLIEDNPADVRIIRELLAEEQAETGRDSFHLLVERRLGAGLNRLQEQEVDVVLLDLSLPDSAGLDTLVQAHEQAPLAPLVVLTGLSDEELGLSALQRGAQDYLVKGKLDPDRLRRSLRYSIERQRLSDELRRLTLVDDLTGLYNRRGFLTLAAQESGWPTAPAAPSCWSTPTWTSSRRSTTPGVMGRETAPCGMSAT